VLTSTIQPKADIPWD